MKICYRGFLTDNHSWAVFGQNICRDLIKLGHEVDMFSTNGTKYFPKDLLPNLKGSIELNQKLTPETYNKLVTTKLQPNYDACFSYTAMPNFSNYLSHSIKNRIGIWAYEFFGKNVLPNGFAKQYRYCDYLCPPSNFAKQIFVDSGIPENIIKVIPHGISENYKLDTVMNLPTKKEFKIGVVIGQNHLRKNIPGLLDAYGKAFVNSDNVCLLLKAKEKVITQQFEVSLNDCLKTFYNKYPKHAEIKVMSEFIDDMSVFYRSVDCLYTLTHCEGYYMPGCEALASGKLNIAPRHGGQLDFLNDDNALLVDGKEGRADPRSMYWSSNINATWFVPNVDDAVDKLIFAYNNFKKLNEKINLDKATINDKYSWATVTKQFLGLCK